MEGAGSRLGGATGPPPLLLHISVLAAVLAAREATPRGLSGASGLQQPSCSLRWLLEDAPWLPVAASKRDRQGVRLREQQALRDDAPGRDRG